MATGDAKVRHVVFPHETLSDDFLILISGRDVADPLGSYSPPINTHTRIHRPSVSPQSSSGACTLSAMTRPTGVSTRRPEMTGRYAGQLCMCVVCVCVCVLYVCMFRVSVCVWEVGCVCLVCLLLLLSCPSRTRPPSCPSCTSHNATNQEHRPQCLRRGHPPPDPQDDQHAPPYSGGLRRLLPGPAVGEQGR